MLPFDGFHVEVYCAGFGVAADGGIAGVGEGAGLAVAETGDVVFIAAEVLLFGGSGGQSDVSCGKQGGQEDKLGRKAYLSLKEQNCWFIICQTISSEAMVKSCAGCRGTDKPLTNLCRVE